MKKQIKQRQDDTQAKQNSNSNSDEAPSPVSDETKQKLVQQYRQRVEDSAVEGDAPIGQGAKWSDYDLNKNWVDIENKHRKRQSVTEGSANGNYLTPAETYSPNQDLHPYQEDASNSMQQIADALTNDTLRQLSSYRNEVNPDYNIKANPLYGYGQDLRDFYSQYGAPVNYPEGYRPISGFIEDVDPELLYQIENSGAADSYQGQADLSRAFNLAENYNSYAREKELEQWANDYRNRQLYGDALMELMAQQQAQNNNRSLVRDAIQATRHQQHMNDLARTRQRNITGSGVVNW